MTQDTHEGRIIGLSVAGSLFGAMAIALMLTGWIDLVPYPRAAAGVFYIFASIIGLTGSARRR